jgi:sugar O-acyltransferase (sialic acid O-acetyltransferase NeuD family)
MKEKLLLVGAGGLGRVVLEHAAEMYDCAFLDDRTLSSVDGTPVIGKIEDIKKLYNDYHLLVVTIGNNALREKIYKRAAKIGYKFPNIIVSSAYISPHARLGTGLIILNNAVVQNNASIGDGTILNPGVEAHHDSTIGKYCLIYTNSVVRSLTHVGDRAWIGSTATISTRAFVPEDAVVSDGTVIAAKE